MNWDSIRRQTDDFLPVLWDWYANLRPLHLAAEVPAPQRAAVFCTDMTVGFCEAGALASDRVGALEGPVRTLFERAYDQGIRNFVLTQDAHHPSAPQFNAWGRHCQAGTPEAETITALTSLPFAHLFTTIPKNSLNPAIGTTLDPWLEDHPDLTTHLVCGNCTDLCVYQLAMHLRLRADAFDLRGHRVVVPADTVDTFDISVADARKVGLPAHPGDLFHLLALYHLHLNGVEVVRHVA